MSCKRNMLIIVMVVIVLFASPRIKADFVFGEAENVGAPINTSYDDGTTYVAPDGLSLYFASNQPGGCGQYDMWMATRPTKGDGWGTPVNLGPTLNTSADEGCPSISGDGLELYFTSDRTGGFGNFDLWVTTRSSVSDPWREPVNLGQTVNGNHYDATPSLSADGLSLFFGSNREKIGTAHPSYCYIYMTMRPTRNDPWGNPVRLGPTVNPGLEYDSDYPSISADGTALFFSSNRLGGIGNGWDIWMAKRSATDAEWGTAVNLGPSVNDSFNDLWPSISPNASTLYFLSKRPGGIGGEDMWQVSITPIVDFNGDGKVDGKEILIMAAHWGQADPLLDIGPYAWGDGVVDVQDIEALAEHIGKDVYDPTLVAHWPLDETEGIRTREIISDKDDYALGGAIWEPAGGKVGGALQLDGVDGSVVTSFNLDPANGPFSILAWVKSGAPGQVIVSQTGGAACLMLDAEGRLMTELASSGPNGSPLQSEAVINDEHWHRVGLIWDGLNRRLCVDDAVVAEDTQDGLVGSGNGLYIGTGTAMQPGSFFSGLIDDVRIYNRAVKP